MKVKERFSESDYLKKMSLLRLFLLCKYHFLMLYLKYDWAMRGLMFSAPAEVCVTARNCCGVCAATGLHSAATKLRRWASWMHSSLSALALSPARAGGLRRLPESHVVLRCRAAAASFLSSLMCKWPRCRVQHVRYEDTLGSGLNLEITVTWFHLRHQSHVLFMMHFLRQSLSDHSTAASADVHLNSVCVCVCVCETVIWNQ